MEITWEITDSSWQPQEFDISAIADGKPQVFLRWTMGTTDGSWEYSGWNVDDVEISAVVPATFENYGPALAGSGGFVPTISGAGGTGPGELFQIAMADGFGRAFTVLAVGTSETSEPFLSGPGTLLVTDLIANPAFYLTGPPLPGIGTASLVASFTDPIIAGSTFYLQAWMVDPGAPGGVSLTNGLRLFANH